ncbi:MAG: Gfo/Idh/MocA family oxidoreductase [Clostridiales bacterium]|jgi:predicted dehydrogenase|nr:Gfo/Idh/MocA family oxidoreductase [Clostridiales bacterium]
MKRVKVAMIGVGAISGIYLKNIRDMFRNIELVGVCDLVRERAEKAAAEYGVPRVYGDMHEAFADSQPEIILNLTRPYEHYDVSMAALKAGKHVYSEKPLAATLAEGLSLAAEAEKRGLLLGGAPDTFLGAGIQTCRRLIDDGYIGEPLGGAAFMICRGHETWHPDPEFYYKHGGGPMLDMGPYYLTALVNLLGRVSEVTGAAKASFAKRRITSQPKYGDVIDVDVPTWANGILQFDSGAIATIFTTFDVYYASQARLEIYGSRGTLVAPDPNTFGGPVSLLRPEDGEAREIPLLFGHRDNSRGVGLSDMAASMAGGGDFRASSNQTLHVLEIMSKILESAEAGRRLSMETPYSRRQPVAEAGL